MSLVSHMQTQKPQRQRQHVVRTTENSFCLVSGLQLLCVRDAAYGLIHPKKPTGSFSKDNVKLYFARRVCKHLSVLIIITDEKSTQKETCSFAFLSQRRLTPLSKMQLTCEVATSRQLGLITQRLETGGNQLASFCPMAMKSLINTSYLTKNHSYTYISLSTMQLLSMQHLVREILKTFLLAFYINLVIEQVTGGRREGIKPEHVSVQTTHSSTNTQTN